MTFHGEEIGILVFDFPAFYVTRIGKYYVKPATRISF
ncbi:MAG: hypothetical protein ACI9ZF_002134 [Bradyrhizobium sp.]|jgi:hypothetical protein